MAALGSQSTLEQFFYRFFMQYFSHLSPLKKLDFMIYGKLQIAAKENVSFLPQLDGPGLVSSLSNKGKLFAKIFLQSLSVDDSGNSLPAEAG